MAQNNKSLVLKVSLILYSVLTIVYGIGYLFFPQTLIDISGGEPCSYGWLRWSGGVLISLGIGAILAFRDLEKQSTLVLTFALATLLCGLALIYSLVFDLTGSTWFAALPATITLINSALLWWAWFLYRVR